MKITGNNHQPFAKDAAGGKSVTENKDGATASTSSASDGASARIDSGLTATKIKERMESLPDKNTARVAELKVAIKNGTFSINPQKIADGMIRESIQDFVPQRN